MRKILRGLLNILLAPFYFLSSLPERFAITRENIRSYFSEEPEDTPLPETVAKAINNPLGLWDHLDDLRKHLLRAVVYLVITTAIAFFFTSQIIDYLARPIGGITRLNPIDVTEPLGVFMRVALLTGFSLALPFIAIELWRFIAPGISGHSRLWGLVAIPAVVIFFVAGMGFAYFIMLPTALPFLLNFLGMTPQIRPASYISFTTGLLFWIGLAFEFPLVIFVLASFGLVKAEMLARQWRIAIVVIAVVAAIVTPTVDPVNMSLVMVPMIVLYFLSIGLARFAQRKRI